jgi:hypothetical protein
MRDYKHLMFFLLCAKRTPQKKHSYDLDSNLVTLVESEIKILISPLFDKTPCTLPGFR